MPAGRAATRWLFATYALPQIDVQCIIIPCAAYLAHAREAGQEVAIIPSVLRTDRHTLTIVRVTPRRKPVRERCRIAPLLRLLARIVLGIDVVDAPRAGAVELNHRLLVGEESSASSQASARQCAIPSPLGRMGLVLGQNLKAGRGKHSSHGYWRQLKVDAVGGVDLVKRAWVAPSWRHAWRCVDSHNSGWNSEFAASWSSKIFACLRSGRSKPSLNEP
jgi:hypothetical protein